MAKKKRGSKKTKSSRNVIKAPTSKKKIKAIFKRFVFFLAFFILFLVLNLVTSNELWDRFFILGEWIFGFISLALLIVLLVLWFIKLMKK